MNAVLSKTNADRPNVLWICTDQQRYDTIRALGNRRINTPNLDRLVRSGVTFTHAYAQSPICTPSRASFLTGRYPRTTRCRQNGQAIPPDERLVTRRSTTATPPSTGRTIRNPTGPKTSTPSG